MLYFEECPNWATARERLEAALGLARQDVSLSYRRVETAEEAKHAGFRGSPTILIDGRDRWAAPGDPTGLSCRIYRTDRGAEGSPSVAQLVEALTP